jgi:hypothetical protein
MIDLVSIDFLHSDAVDGGGALRIRQNYADMRAGPAWVAGRDSTASDSIATYAASQVRGQTIRISVQLRARDSMNCVAEVRAIDARKTDVPAWVRLLPHYDLLWPQPRFFATTSAYAYFLAYVGLYHFWQTWLAVGSNVLGEVRPQTVAFSPDGTASQEFELQNVRICDRGVGSHPVAWAWQYRLAPHHPWTDIGTTRHTIYTVLAPPTAPWVQEPDADPTQLPWIDVLEIACRWASGARNKREAARRVTEHAFGLGAGVLRYGCMIGTKEMYANSVLDTFDCSSFVDRLRGGVGNGPFVNCNDCACIVSTLANILGCDLWQSRMGQYIPPFRTNSILTIGASEFASPCKSGFGFTYHEVAWTGMCSSNDEVYDACLAVDSDIFPTLSPHRGVLATGMRFGSVGDGQFRDRLAAPLDRSVCEPRPQEKLRRSLL